MNTIPPEHEPETWKLLGTTLWGIIIVLVFLTVQIATSIEYLLLTHPHINQNDLGNLLGMLSTDGNALALSTFTSTIVCVPLILVLAKIKRRSVLTHYFPTKLPSAKEAGLWTLACLLLLAGIDLFLYLIEKSITPEFMNQNFASADPVWFFAFALVIMTPLFEEFFFRGFLFTGIASSSLGPVWAIFLTALVWTSIHVQYGILELSVIFCLGLLLGYARLRTGSLIIPLWLHALVNMGATLETWLLTT